MKIGLISIALLLLLLPGCSRHRDQRTAQANREPTHVASLPPAGVRPESLTKVAPQTLDRSRPSPFSDRPELELQQPALSQSARIAPAPSAAAPPSRAKIATKPEEKRKTLKPFNPKVADPSCDRVALLPVPPALPAISQNPVSNPIPGHKTCCVGTATFEPAPPPRLQRVRERVPGRRRITQNTGSPDAC